MTRRVQRVNVVLRQEISRVLAEELKDPRLSAMVSVTLVRTASDLRSAKVYVSVLGDATEKADTLAALRSASGFVRRSIRRRLSLRSVPHVEFQIDESIERGAELLKLISEVAPCVEGGETS